MVLELYFKVTAMRFILQTLMMPLYAGEIQHRGQWIIYPMTEQLIRLSGAGSGIIEKNLSMYNNRILAYIDILGFSDIIRKTVNNNEEVIPETEKIYNFFTEAQAQLKKKYPDIDKNGCSLKTNQCSDSFIISYEITEKSGVFHLLAAVLFLCVNALQNGFLLRGAITIGKLCHEEKIIFGPALVEAVKMEEELAIYPRIVFDDRILDIAKKYPASYPGKSEQSRVIHKLVKKDFDSLNFVNYFSAINFVIGDSAGILVCFDYLKKIIVELKKNASNNMNLKSKYLWLMEKYNKTLTQFKNKYCKNKNDNPDLYDYLNNATFFQYPYHDNIENNIE